MSTYLQDFITLPIVLSLIILALPGCVLGPSSPCHACFCFSPFWVVTTSSLHFLCLAVSCHNSRCFPSLRISSDSLSYSFVNETLPYSALVYLAKILPNYINICSLEQRSHHELPLTELPLTSCMVNEESDMVNASLHCQGKVKNGKGKGLGNIKFK